MIRYRTLLLLLLIFGTPLNEHRLARDKFYARDKKKNRNWPNWASGRAALAYGGRETRFVKHTDSRQRIQ